MLARLQSVTAAFSRALAPRAVARVAVANGLEALGAQESGLSILFPDGSHLGLVDYEGMSDAMIAQFRRLPLTVMSPASDAMRDGKPVYIESSAAYATAYPELAPKLFITAHGGHAHGVHGRGAHGSKVALPLAVDGRAFGILGFGFDTWRPIDDVERAFMESLAAVTAQALDRARLYADSLRALGEAEAANELKDEFLATVSHELRTPLNAILGWAAMLAEPTSAETQQRGLEVIARNARALARLVDDVLDGSRIAGGKLSVQHASVAVGPMVRTAIDAALPAMSAKDIELETSISEDAGVVIGDAERLQQVVWNLLANAVKFTPRRGRVRVVVERDGELVRIAVTDTGIGIAPEFLPHVFEPFRQFDSSTTRQQGGLGLGLTIARNLVELHGSTLSATSPGIGQGATFVFELARSPTASEPPAPRSSIPVHALAGAFVLVADDAPDSRDLVACVLQSAGARVEAVSTAKDAMTVIARETPDVIIADIGMPVDDGYRLMTWLRALAPGAGGCIPAVALTGYVSDGDRHAVLDAGYAAHLAKPASPMEIVAVVADLIKTRPASTS